MVERGTKTDRLKRAYADMKSGKIIEFIPDEGKRKLTHGCRCWIGRSRVNRRRYIFWRYLGQSANAMGLDNLRWIAKVIGDCTTYEYKVVSSIYGD